jgi:hypothetical protein
MNRQNEANYLCYLFSLINWIAYWALAHRIALCYQFTISIFLTISISLPIAASERKLNIELKATSKFIYK